MVKGLQYRSDCLKTARNPTRRKRPGRGGPAGKTRVHQLFFSLLDDCTQEGCPAVEIRAGHRNRRKEFADLEINEASRSAGPGFRFLVSAPVETRRKPGRMEKKYAER